MLPWFIDLSQYEPEECVKALLARREKSLQIPSMDIFELDEQLINIMAKAMSYDVKDRFRNATEFIKALDYIAPLDIQSPSETPKMTPKVNSSAKKTKKIGYGYCFFQNFLIYFFNIFSKHNSCSSINN